MSNDLKQWNKLLQAIAKGVVIPIVGRDLLRIEVEGREQLLYFPVCVLSNRTILTLSCRHPILSGLADQPGVVQGTHLQMSSRGDSRWDSLQDYPIRSRPIICRSAAYSTFPGGHAQATEVKSDLNLPASREDTGCRIGRSDRRAGRPMRRGNKTLAQ
jgi:hypothetical protein